MFDCVVEPNVAIEFEPIADKESGGAKRVGVVRRQLVAGQHLHDHTVVTDVAIERFDNPIAPAPDVWLAFADFRPVAVPVAVPPDIHPVAAPAFSVRGRSEQAIDIAFDRVGSVVAKQFSQLVFVRRQADEVERQATDEHSACRRFGRRDPRLLTTGLQPSIDRAAEPLRRRCHRRGGDGERLDRPVPQRLAGRRQPRALIDPAAQGGDLFGGQRVAGRRHPLVVLGGDSMDQQARTAVARGPERAAVAAFAQGVGGIETQVRLSVEGGAMAFRAPRGEDRSHLARVIHRLIRFGGS